LGGATRRDKLIAEPSPRHWSSIASSHREIQTETAPHCWVDDLVLKIEFGVPMPIWRLPMQFARLLRSFFVAGLILTGVMAGFASKPVRAEMSAAPNQDKAAAARAQVVDEVFAWNRSHAARVFDQPNLTVIGNPNGKITLVEFFDYNCLHCRHMVSDLGRLMKANPDFRIVLEDFAILTPKSKEAALVALAVHRQFNADKFWQFYQRLMVGHHSIDEAGALAAAKDMGADMTQLNEDLNGTEITAQLDEIKSLADALDFHGTPSFLMGDSTFWGEQSFDKLNGFITNMRQCGKTSCG
jgi:protein-disulfide isomerase